MSRFEERNVRAQHDSVNPEEADLRFRKACEVCASHGFCGGGDCDSCPIAAANAFVKDTFAILAEVTRKHKHDASHRALRAR